MVVRDGLPAVVRRPAGARRVRRRARALLLLTGLAAACGGATTLADLRALEAERDAYALVKIFLAEPSGSGRSERLHSRRVRDAAGESLVRLGPAAVPELARAIKGASSADRGRVAGVLSRIPPQGVDALLSFVEAHPESLERPVAEALARTRHPRAVPLLVAAFRESLAQRRGQTTWLATCLGWIRRPEANAALLAAWPRVTERHDRLALLQALGTGGARDCVNVAITALADPDEEVRLAAAVALGASGPRGVEVVVRLFYSQRPDEQRLGEAGVRSAGAAAAVPLIQRVGTLPERSLDVLARVADSLVLYATKRKVTVDLGDRYGRALCSLDDGLPETAAGLDQAFAHRDAGVRRVAAQALGLLQSPESVPALARVAVEDANEWVRAEAVLALGLICDELAAVEVACRARLERRADAPAGAGIVGCDRARISRVCRERGLVGLASAAQDLRVRTRLAVARALVQLTVGGALRDDVRLRTTLERLSRDANEEVGFEARQGLAAFQAQLQ